MWPCRQWITRSSKPAKERMGRNKEKDNTKRFGDYHRRHRRTASTLFFFPCYGFEYKKAETGESESALLAVKTGYSG